MSWDQDGQLQFVCDGADCNSVVIYPLSPSAGCPAGTDFIACKLHLSRQGWVSLKRTGREWEDFCRNCAGEAQLRHLKYRQDETEREQQRSRNG